MRIPLTQHCSACHEPFTLALDPDEPDLDFACACGHRNSGFLDPRQPVAERLLRRALREIAEHGDMSVAILYAGAAFESEAWRVAHRHAPWLESARGGTAPATLAQRPESASLLDALASVADPLGMDHLLEARPDLCSAASLLAARGPVPRACGLDAGLEAALLRPRDRILRWGEARRGEDEARSAFAWAALGLRLLEVIEDGCRARARRAV